MLGGMKCLVSGGIQLKDYPGRWLESRQRMDVSLGRFSSTLLTLKLCNFQITVEHNFSAISKPLYP